MSMLMCVNKSSKKNQLRNDFWTLPNGPQGLPDRQKGPTNKSHAHEVFPSFFSCFLTVDHQIPT